MENKLRNILLGGLALSLIACAGNSQPTTSQQTNRELSGRERHFYQAVRHEAEIRKQIDHARNYDYNPRIQLACSIAHTNAHGEFVAPDRESIAQCYAYQGGR